MSTDTSGEPAGIRIRIEGAAGCITLDRPDALNALSYPMCLAIEDALDTWRGDDKVALVIIDATGDKAFCAGGDIQEMYATGTAGDYGYGRRFWRDEYRLNLKLHDYPKPVVSLMQGFTMGGGVGVGCHGSHRVVCETSQIAMPEVGIGLVPDVGGSWILAQAPGQLGAYLGLTAARMGPGDAIRAGFADFFVPRENWGELRKKLLAGTISPVADMAEPAPESALAADQGWIDRAFGAPDLAGIVAALDAVEGGTADRARKALSRNSPLAMAAALSMIRTLKARGSDMAEALRQEYRFTHRAMEHGDFLEGIRAAIIDKDRNPRWRHESPGSVTEEETGAMLAPLGEDELRFDREKTE